MLPIMDEPRASTLSVELAVKVERGIATPQECMDYYVEAMRLYMMGGSRKQFLHRVERLRKTGWTIDQLKENTF